MSELIGVELDAAVAKAAGFPIDADGDRLDLRTNGGAPTQFHPSTNWADGGPIIERERISVVASFSHPADGPIVFRRWFAEMPDGAEVEGPTPLAAAMRAFVASKS